MSRELYPQGFDQAKRLVEEGRISDDPGDWHELNPGTEAQDAFIEEHGVQAWGLWHLAYRPEDDPDTKEAYGFPYGNYQTVAREGVLAAESRARQFGYREIAEAALELLKLIDAKLGIDRPLPTGAGDEHDWA